VGHWPDIIWGRIRKRGKLGKKNEEKEKYLKVKFEFK
jgi:hypothetical protein